MKVILRSDVDGLGRSGDLVDVATGYARNFLLPKGIAMKATKGAEADAQATQKARALKLASTKVDAEAQAAILGPATINISAKSGDGHRLFGSVTAVEVAEAIHAQTGVEVDRKSLKVDPIKTVGTHSVSVHLHPQVNVAITVEVSAAS